MKDDPDAFFKLVNLLLSSDNEIRQQAESTYNEIAIEVKVTHFLKAVLDQNMGENERYTSAILLRRLFAKEFDVFYRSLGTVEQTQLKEYLLTAVQQSSNQSEALRKKVCDLVAEVAQNLINNENKIQWSEFLEFMYQCLTSNNSKLKDSCLRIFIALPRAFDEIQSKDNVIKKIFENCFQRDTADIYGYDVSFQAVRALGAYLIEYEEEPQVTKQMTCFLPQFMNVINESIEKGDDDTLLKVLVEVAEKVPKFLRPLLQHVIKMNMLVVANEKFQFNFRQLALEVIVVLTEVISAPVRKNCAKEISDLVPCLLEMMTIIEDDEEFAESDEVLDDENDSINVIAEAAIDRICCGLGGKLMLPVIVNNIKSMLQDERWNYRHAALMAISAIGEGCKNQMQSMLPEIVNGVTIFFKDSHPRVRFAACNAIGQMCSDFAPLFEKKFHDRIVPGLLELLDDKQNPRVQAHAGAALVNFSEDCTKEILIIYIDAIMEKLIHILTEHIDIMTITGKKLVLSQIITTIASVASTSSEHFAKYYSNTMPMMKFILSRLNDENTKALRGKTIECISLIGLAVGADTFMADASDILDMLLKIHTDGNLTESDPENGYLISAWERICKILGKQFVRFLPLVMEPVMRTASIKPEFAVLDKEDMEQMNDDNDDWQFVSLSAVQNFGFRTSGLDDKASACSMLVCYARELKEGFVDYAEDVVRLMVTLLKFYFHDGVRCSAAESLPLLLECVKPKGQEYIISMWKFICPDLIKAVESEADVDVLVELISSLAGCIEIIGPGCLTDEEISKVIVIISDTLKSHFEKAKKRREKHLEEDYDEVVESELETEESEDGFLLSKISELLHALFVTYKESFLPYFERIIDHINTLLKISYLWSDHQIGLCIVDDLIEFTGPAFSKYQTLFMQPLMQYVQDKNADVRQAAVYGWGVLAQFGGSQYANHCKEIIPYLIQMINENGSRLPENINPTENAISTITKILKYNNSMINCDELIPLWFDWLPVHEDEVEAPHVYGYLCDLVANNHPLILNNLSRLMAIISDVILHKTLTVDHEVFKRLIQLLKQIQGNESVFNNCLNALNDNQKQAIYAVLVYS